MPVTNKYKYRLRELFIAHFGSDWALYRRHMIENNQLKYRTVQGDFNLRLSSHKRISAKRLSIYAMYLNTTIENLKTTLHA